MWLYLHLIGQVFVILWTSHMYHLIIDVFIPLTGRSGGSSNPDIVIGIISCFFTLLMTSLLVTEKFEIRRISSHCFVFHTTGAAGWTTQQTENIARRTCIGLHFNTCHVRRDPFRFPLQ